MEILAEFFIEVFFGRLIVRFLGLRTRLLFFKLFKKDITMDDLTGKKGDDMSYYGQDFLNAIVGVFVGLALFFLIGYLFLELL